MEKSGLLRGQVYYAQLGSMAGCEQSGTRPVIIVQNNKGNRCSPTVVVVPITSQHKPALPTHVILQNIPQLAHKSCVLTEQIRTIDRSRLGTYLCQLPPEVMDRVDYAVAICVGLVSKYN
ncbi:MAG: type II toxin-antitoxin system PemK/MazF family toxin [Eubacteriales bacterium]